MRVRLCIGPVSRCQRWLWMCASQIDCRQPSHPWWWRRIWSVESVVGERNLKVKSWTLNVHINCSTNCYMHVRIRFLWRNFTAWVLWYWCEVSQTNVSLSLVLLILSVTGIFQLLVVTCILINIVIFLSKMFVFMLLPADRFLVCGIFGERWVWNYPSFTH